MFSKVHDCCYSKDVLFWLIIIISFIFTIVVIIIFIIHNLYNDRINIFSDPSIKLFLLWPMYIFNQIIDRINVFTEAYKLLVLIIIWQYWSCHFFI